MSAEITAEVMLNAIAAIHDKAPGIIATTVGAEHRFTYANQTYCDLVGRTDLIGRRVIDAIPEVESQGFIELLDGVWRTGEAFVGKNLPIRLGADANGEETLRYVSFVYQPMRDASGTIIGLFMEGHESTAEVVATEQLECFQEDLSHACRVNAMGLMAATLAHELNQPLTAISMYSNVSAGLLSAGEVDPETLGRALRGIDAAAQRAGSIIRTMRSFSKRGSRISVFPLKVLMVEAIDLVNAGSCPSATIYDDTPPDLSIRANRVEILQVMVNLLRNACEASIPDRTNIVRMTAWSDDKDVVVSVRDRGRGVSSQAALDMFAWTESDKDDGTGLGLPICRTIIDALGGRIWLEGDSTAGCDFRFSLPLSSGSEN